MVDALLSAVENLRVELLRPTDGKERSNTDNNIGVVVDETSQSSEQTANMESKDNSADETIESQQTPSEALSSESTEQEDSDGDDADFTVVQCSKRKQVFTPTSDK